jgi:hypothetical protein
MQISDGEMRIDVADLEIRIPQFEIRNLVGAPTENRTLNRGLKVRYVASYAIGA